MGSQTYLCVRVGYTNIRRRDENLSGLSLRCVCLRSHGEGSKCACLSLASREKALARTTLGSDIPGSLDRTTHVSSVERLASTGVWEVDCRIIPSRHRLIFHFST